MESSIQNASAHAVLVQFMKRHTRRRERGSDGWYITQERTHIRGLKNKCAGNNWYYTTVVLCGRALTPCLVAGAASFRAIVEAEGAAQSSCSLRRVSLPLLLDGYSDTWAT